MKLPPQSVLDVWLLYQQDMRQDHPASKATALLAQAKSALCRYTLPGWGLSLPQGKGLTKQATADALAFMAQIPVAQLAQAAPVQQGVFDARALPLQTQRTYRHALLRLLHWCETQPWWTEPLVESLLPVQPRIPKGSACLEHVTERRRVDDQGQQLYDYAYGLGQVPGDVLSTGVEAELAAFYQYRTAPEATAGLSPVQPATATEELDRLRLLLGWLHRERQVPLDQLSLRQLVPSVGTLTEPPLQADAAATVALADAYLQWLQATPVVGDKPQRRPRSQSDQTPLRWLRLWQTIAKFVYHAPASCTAGARPEAPVLEALQQRLWQLVAPLSSHQSLNLAASKRLERDQFRDLVEALRQECQPRQWHATATAPGQSSPGAWRSPATIAFCYQRFLFAALLELLPQRRSVFWRRLVVVLPGTNFAVAAVEGPSVGVSGFLALAAGQWCIHLTQSTTTAQGKIILPNQRYDDDRCFYTYLEEWLVQYTDAKRTLPGLRSVFQPKHDYLLTKRNGQPYTRANALKHLLRNPAFRLTGQLPTPETIRLVFKD